MRSQDERLDWSEANSEMKHGVRIMVMPVNKSAQVST